MQVNFVDVKSQNRILKPKLLKRFGDVIDSCDFILGEDVRCFENEFAEYCGAKFAVGVNSGTDALFLALLSLGIGRGDEVICPVYTYIATALSISYTGAKPVFVDIDERTFNLNADKLESKINKSTKAIIAVHLFGQPANLEKIMDVAKRHKIKVIEDAAQAHGALIEKSTNRWRRVGAIADLGCFSFYPTKNLSGCGDGGIILTNEKKIYEKLLMLRDQGRKGNHRYLHYIMGYNARLDSLQAAMLREKLPYLEESNKQRQKSAKLYSELLETIPGVVVPYVDKSVKHVFHIYALLIRERDQVHKKLIDKGIKTAIIYHLPLHLQKTYKNLKYKKGDFPVAEKIAKNILCLPMHAFLTNKQVRYVAESLNGIMGIISVQKRKKQ
ncbi:MAG: DegT/DnrJ/EryC1/StrS family aminotransferase [Candidatus Omnitrophica bacterium]|nr:DegT/DnrJ/EryC1/StrS family aminotransferase [Candidatus Omnitrophota bacterium]